MLLDHLPLLHRLKGLCFIVMRACSGSRKRKIRCDVATTNSWPCSACMRARIICVRPAGGTDGFNLRAMLDCFRRLREQVGWASNREFSCNQLAFDGLASKPPCVPADTLSGRRISTEDTVSLYCRHAYPLSFGDNYSTSRVPSCINGLCGLGKLKKRTWVIVAHRQSPFVVCKKPS